MATKRITRYLVVKVDIEYDEPPNCDQTAICEAVDAHVSSECDYSVSLPKDSQDGELSNLNISIVDTEMQGFLTGNPL